MNHPYAKVYEKRCNYDPFSNREGIDSRTALEDLFSAFLGELIERITDGVSDWEFTYIYLPSITMARASSRYNPHAILTTKELNPLLSRSLDTWPSTDTDEYIARTIQARFSDIEISFDELLKLLESFLFSTNSNNPAPVKNAQCPSNSFSAVRKMCNDIREFRNPSSHRSVSHSEISAENLRQKSDIALTSIRDALPKMSRVFSHFTSADEVYLRERYLPVLSRILDDLDKKINGIDIDLSAKTVHYKALSSYHIFLDESALTSGYSITLAKVMDEMQVFLYGDSLSSVAKTTANPNEMTKHTAKAALDSMVMAKQNIVIMKNLKETDRQSILEVLKNNPSKKFFVVTESVVFANQIYALKNSNHIAARIRNNRGEFMIYEREPADE